MEILSGEKGLGKVGSAVVKVIKVTVNLLAPIFKEKGMEHLVDEGWLLEKLRYCWKLVGLMRKEM